MHQNPRNLWLHHFNGPQGLKGDAGPVEPQGPPGQGFNTCDTITSQPGGQHIAVLEPGSSQHKTRIIENSPVPPGFLPTQGETKDICIVPPDAQQSQPP